MDRSHEEKQILENREKMGLGWVERTSFIERALFWKHTFLSGTVMFQTIGFKIMQTVSIWHATENTKF